MKKNLMRWVIVCFMFLFSVGGYAWTHSVSLGYGLSHDPNNTKYNNSGLLLSGDFYPIYRNSWSFWSLNAALGQWHSNAPENQNLTTGAVSLALRLYPIDIADLYPAYLFGSAGPALMSNQKFGLNEQASNLSIQSMLGFGVEFDHIDVNLRYSHYSNAGLGKPNEGFNVLYMLSIGYLFD